MKVTKRRSCQVWGLCPLLVLLSMVIPATGQCQEAVWDPEEIAQLAQKSARMAESLSHAVELLGAVNDLSRTIGRFGSLSSLDFTRLDVVEGLQGAGPQIGGLASNIAALQHVKIGSFDDATAFVHSLTSVAAGGEQTTKARQVSQALDALSRKALEDGYALSTHTRESLGLSPGRAQLLVAQAGATENLREDLGANTAASLAVLEQLGSLRAMLASILEIQTTAKLVKVTPTVSVSQ